jgi:hypothetical protein
VTPEERIKKALRSPDSARALRSLVLELSREGQAQTKIYELLENFVIQLRARPDHRESDEDPVLDAMDALSGWCHPDAELPSG